MPSGFLVLYVVRHSVSDLRGEIEDSSLQFTRL